MTTINYTNNIRDGFRIQAIGHAGYAEKGKDIVCASISTLLSTLLLHCLKAKENQSIKRLKIKTNNGEWIISFRYSTTGNAHTINQVIQVVLELLESLAEQYPNHVKIVKGEYE